MTPFEPGETCVVRPEAWCRIEVVAGDQHALRVRAAERNVDESVDWLLGTGRVVLANPNHAPADNVHDAIRVTQAPRLRWSFGDRERWCSRLLPVQALVGIVGKIDDTLADQIRATAIFVDPCADIEGALSVRRHRRCHIGRPPGLRAADYDRSSLFLRATFNPINIAAVDQDIAETNRGGDDQIGRDRRCPRPIGGDPRLRHDGTPEFRYS